MAIKVNTINKSIDAQIDKFIKSKNEENERFATGVIYGLNIAKMIIAKAIKQEKAQVKE